MTYDNNQIGRVIRDLRKQRGLTGEALGRKTGISQPKISKIESGMLKSPSTEDLAKILNTLEAPQAIRQQVELILKRRVGELRITRYTQKGSRDYSFSIERSVRDVRIYVMGLIPTLLQTADYRMALKQHYSIEDIDMGHGMKYVLLRQELMWEKGRSYHIIIHETALYTLLSNRLTHVAQLARLDWYIGLKSIKIGIIPLQAGFVVAENSNFGVFSDEVLVIALADEELESRNKSRIAQHLKIFNDLDQKAWYTDDASQLIRKAIQYFS